MKKAVFLDRDGTINVDPGYLNHPDQMKLLPRVGEALKLLHDAGYELIIVSNQSGVGRGLVQEAMLEKIHARMNELLEPFSVKIKHFALCVHHPNEDCECRKPKPKLILDWAKKLKVSLANSFMVGDKFSDLHAGRAAGCKAVALVRTGYGKETEVQLKPVDADFVGDSLFEIAQWILG